VSVELDGRPFVPVVPADVVRSAVRPAEKASSPYALSPPVRLSLMNGFELYVDGATMLLPLSAQRLLVFLALQDRPVTRVFVASNLWLDKSEDRAGANLRSVLWRTRSCHRPLVHATSTHVALDDGVVVDVRELRREAKRMISGEIGPLPSWADEAFLCGDLLPDWYDEWIVAERERLRQLRLHALERICRRYIELGQYPQAIEAGLAAVSVDPLRESGHRAVIEAHVAEGNNAEAVRQYRSLTRVLAEQLGVEPSPITRECMAGLLPPLPRPA
jgi:DNA-binding SARP family transcriptional activator